MKPKQLAWQRGAGFIKTHSKKIELEQLMPGR